RRAVGVQAWRGARGLEPRRRRAGRSEARDRRRRASLGARPVALRAGQAGAQGRRPRARERRISRRRQIVRERRRRPRRRGREAAHQMSEAGERTGSRRTWVSVLIASVIIVGVLALAVVGGTAFFIYRHVHSEFTNETSAKKEFAGARARFASQRPLIEI